MNSIAIGQSVTQTVTFTLAAAGTIGTPIVVTQGIPSLDFSDAGTGTCTTNGTVHTYNIGDTCTVDVTFKPTQPGARYGAAELTDSSGAKIATAYLYGTGTGPRVVFSPSTITTAAGNGTAGYSGDGGAATSAELNHPFDAALDGLGNLYIADTVNHAVRKVNASTGVITTVAGNGTYGYSGDGGPATAAQLASPYAIALDGAGNLYIADLDSYVIREVDAATGTIKTVAGTGVLGYSGDGGPAIGAEITQPMSVAVNGAGDLYIALPDTVREVNAATGIITTVAGGTTAGYSGDGGAAINAELSSQIRGLAVDGAGNLYIADSNNCRLRKVDATTGVITTVAGNGTCGYSGDGGAATGAEINYYFGLAVDSVGNLYIADAENNRIRKVNAVTGIITTVAGDGTQGYGGDGGAANAAELSSPQGVAVEGTGNLYIADTYNHRIRKVDLRDAPNLRFGSINAGTTIGPQVVTMENNGNTALTFPPPAAGQNPSLGADFQLDSASTCPLLYTTSSSASLAADASCTSGIYFEPTTAGSITGSLVLTDNSLNSAAPNYTTQTISLNGTANVVVPDAPIIGAVTVAPAQAMVHFAPPSFTGGATITRYNAVSSPGGLTATCATSPCTVTGLTNGTAYTFTVTATNSAGTSVPSASSSPATPSPSQTITFSNPGTQTYGTTFTLAATASSGLAVTFTSNTAGVCTISSGIILAFARTGTCTIVAHQNGNSIYSAALEVAQSFAVQAAPLSVTANDSTRTYGAANPAFAGTVSGLVNGDTPASVGLVYKTTATTTSATGSYPITATISSSNYALNVSPGTLNITAATPILQWSAPAAIAYGTPLSATQLDAVATSNGIAVPGTFAYTPAPGTVLTTGPHTLSVSFTPADTTDYTVAAGIATSITVTKPALIITANDASRVYGAANPAFTGSIAGTVNGDTFTESFSTTATMTSNTGKYAIVPTVTGANLGDYAVSTANGALTITQAATTTTLKASATTITPGQSLTLTATVASATTGAPTGTVNFYDGPTLLGGSTLINGAASYTTSTLAAGVTHNLLATYSGDTNFIGSTTSSNISVPVAAQDFSVAVSGTQSQAIALGGSATYIFRISPSYGSYPSQVTFSAAGLPAGATATFSPATVGADAGTQTVTLTIQTAAGSASNSNALQRGGTSLALGFLLLPLLGIRRRRNVVLVNRILLLLAAAALVPLIGCGGSSGSSSGGKTTTQNNYSITVAATSGGIQHSFNINLEVQ